MNGIDMASGADALGGFGDYLAAHPGLPVLVSVQMSWNHVETEWEISGQLADDPAELVAWADVMRAVP
ncbi:hypothetical protein [Yinghuangia seranimata]|uniref:hypothetical protein n=1 Tax=Yinghuangia seranimata TaxID=408067 RepID=UPI00248B1A51|nr:hypothetical protein [Yinghuangia seranimata]MDI2130824.1 hypothetical protein [Yinghuangia seranimata]